MKVLDQSAVISWGYLSIIREICRSGWCSAVIPWELIVFLLTISKWNRPKQACPLSVWCRHPVKQTPEIHGGTWPSGRDFQEGLVTRRPTKGSAIRTELTPSGSLSGRPILEIKPLKQQADVTIQIEHLCQQLRESGRVSLTADRRWSHKWEAVNAIPCRRVPSPSLALPRYGFV